MAEQHSEV